METNRRSFIQAAGAAGAALTLSDDERPSGVVEAEYRSDAQGDATPKSN